MSALIAYYNAMTQDKAASANLAQSQARQVDANTGEVAANAAAQRGVEGAQANLTNANASQVVPLAQSEIANRDAQSNLAGASAESTRTNTGLAGALAGSEIGLRSAQAGLTGAQAGVVGANALSENELRSAQGLNLGAQTNQTNIGTRQLDSLAPGAGAGFDKFYGLNGLTLGQLQQIRLRQSGQTVAGYAEGTSDVTKPAKPGKTDTIPAMLSPGEAVLNRGATEHLGSGVVDHLNKLGMLRMAAQDEIKAHAKAVNGHSMEAAMTAASKAMKTAAGAAKSKRGASSKAA